MATGVPLTASSEAEIFKLLGFRYVPPELRNVYENWKALKPEVEGVGEGVGAGGSAMFGSTFGSGERSFGGGQRVDDGASDDGGYQTP